MLEVGVHGSHVARPADAGGPDTAAGAARYTVTMQERPELRVDGTRLISTERHQRPRTPTAWSRPGQLGSFFLQGEYESFKIERRNAAAGVSDPDFDGYYGGRLLPPHRREAAVQHRHLGLRRRRRWTIRSASPGSAETFELAGRTISNIDLNAYHAGALAERPFPAPTPCAAAEQTIWAGGLNWVPERASCASLLDYQDVKIDRLSPSADDVSLTPGRGAGRPALPRHRAALAVRLLTAPPSGLSL